MPHNALLRVVLTLFCCLALPATGVAQPQTGSVSGFVRDTADGEGVIRATVLVEGLPLGGLTNIQGYYVLPKVPVGTQTLVFTYIGYAAVRKTVTITSDTATRLDVRLQPEVLLGQEVVIRADSMRAAEMLFRKPISQIRLNPAQIRSLPQVAESDLLRSLQSLPGVLPLSDFSSALYVRGGTPDQNLYLLDGTDVYNPEHTFGIFSTFNTDAIKQADMSKGGFGAEYGGRLSSVLDVTNLDGNREEFEGTASLSLLSAKTTLQAPLGERGSLSGSIRRTYFDQTIARALDDIPDYWFYDGNLKAYVEFSPRDQLTVSTYGGRDYLDVIFNPDAADPTGIAIDWGNKTGSLRWTRVITPELFGTFWLTGSRFTSDFSLPIADVTERNVVTDVTFKGNVEHHYSDALTTRFGFEEKNLNVEYNQDFPEGHILLGHEPTHLVLYATSSLRPSSRWEIEPGLRFNHFSSDKTFRNLAPRLSVKHRLTDTFNLRAATGVYYQYLHRVPRFAFTDIFISSNQH
ncbi:MAG: TonB-dependent receptor plug domain-containing protein, partial [Candidatus Marinimicrobia bacterium]|nr:TonB-dependent receptor plug domain-containing protein [Candidatus Neomarinimicrobiota bacterium]